MVILNMFFEFIGAAASHGFCHHAEQAKNSACHHAHDNWISLCDHQQYVIIHHHYAMSQDNDDLNVFPLAIMDLTQWSPSLAAIDHLSNHNCTLPTSLVSQHHINTAPIAQSSYEKASCSPGCPWMFITSTIGFHTTPDIQSAQCPIWKLWEATLPGWQLPNTAEEGPSPQLTSSRHTWQPIYNQLLGAWCWFMLSYQWLVMGKQLELIYSPFGK